MSYALFEYHKDIPLDQTNALLKLRQVLTLLYIKKNEIVQITFPSL